MNRTPDIFGKRRRKLEARLAEFDRTKLIIKVNDEQLMVATLNEVRLSAKYSGGIIDYLNPSLVAPGVAPVGVVVVWDE